MSKHKPLTLNQHEKISAILKQARNDVERVRKIAPRPDPDDPTLQQLERFWVLFEDICCDHMQRMTRDHNVGEQPKYYARNVAGNA